MLSWNALCSVLYWVLFASLNKASLSGGPEQRESKILSDKDAHSPFTEPPQVKQAGRATPSLRQQTINQGPEPHTQAQAHTADGRVALMNMACPRLSDKLAFIL